MKYVSSQICECRGYCEVENRAMLRLHNCNIIVLDGIFNSSEVKCIKSKKLFKQVIDLYSECKLLNIEIYTLQGDNSKEGIRDGMRRPLVNTYYKPHPRN